MGEAHQQPAEYDADQYRGLVEELRFDRARWLARLMPYGFSRREIMVEVPWPELTAISREFDMKDWNDRVWQISMAHGGEAAQEWIDMHPPPWEAPQAPVPGVPKERLSSLKKAWRKTKKAEDQLSRLLGPMR